MRTPPKVIHDSGRHRRLRELLRTLPALQLESINRATLWDNALLHWHWMQEHQDQPVTTPTTRADRHRLIVCWIRHEASNYDKILDLAYAAALSFVSTWLTVEFTVPRVGCTTNLSTRSQSLALPVR